jgi:excisionase family DNA binding protein
MKKPKDKLLTVTTVSGTSWLNCSKSYTYRLVDEGHLKGLYLGEKKGLRIFQSSVEAFLNDRIKDFLENR